MRVTGKLTTKLDVACEGPPFPVAPAQPHPTSPRGGRLSDRAYVVLEEAIISGQLRPNDLLSEAELMERTGLGRTPLRDAIQRLAKDHLVSIVPYRGAFVAPLDPRTELTLIEMRRELDPVLVGTAASTATPLHCDQLGRLLREMITAEPLERLAAMRIDRQFKEILLEACANPYLTMTVRPLYALSRRFYFNAVRSPPGALLRPYATMIESVASGYADGARAASLAFLDALEVFARQLLLEPL